MNPTTSLSEAEVDLCHLPARSINPAYLCRKLTCREYAFFGWRALWRTRNLFLYFYQRKQCRMAEREGFEHRAWKRVPLACRPLTLGGRVPFRASPNLPWEMPCRFFRRGFDQIVTISDLCWNWLRRLESDLFAPIKKSRQQTNSVTALYRRYPSTDSNRDRFLVAPTVLHALLCPAVAEG